jgi:hypothetical protein
MVGVDTLVELQNVAAMVVRKLELVRGVLVEQRILTIEYITLVTTITQQLLEKIIGKLNKEAAGFQLLQWLLIAQEEWSTFAESVLHSLSNEFSQVPQSQYRDFLAACEVFGVSFSTVLSLLEIESVKASKE